MIEGPRLFTSYWRNPDLASLEAVLVSISRGEPRWRLPFSYRRLRDLAPGDEAWNAEDQVAFERSYLGQLKALGAETVLAELGRISDEHGGKPLCFLCWERLDGSDDWCHRRMLAGWLEEQTGIVVPELEAGTLARKPDAQPALFE